MHRPSSRTKKCSMDKQRRWIARIPYDAMGEQRSKDHPTSEWAPTLFRRNLPGLMIVNECNQHDCNRSRTWRYHTCLEHGIALPVDQLNTKQGWMRVKMHLEIYLCSSLWCERMDRYERIPIEHRCHWREAIFHERIHRTELWRPSIDRQRTLVIPQWAFSTYDIILDGIKSWRGFIRFQVMLDVSST